MAQYQARHLGCLQPKKIKIRRRKSTQPTTCNRPAITSSTILNNTRGTRKISQKQRLQEDNDAQTPSSRDPTTASKILSISHHLYQSNPSMAIVYIRNLYILQWQTELRESHENET